MTQRPLAGPAPLAPPQHADTSGNVVPFGRTLAAPDPACLITEVPGSPRQRTTWTSGRDFPDLMRVEPTVMCASIDDAITYRTLCCPENPLRSASASASNPSFNIKAVTSYRDNVMRRVAPAVAYALAQHCTQRSGAKLPSQDEMDCVLQSFYLRELAVRMQEKVAAAYQQQQGGAGASQPASPRRSASPSAASSSGASRRAEPVLSLDRFMRSPVTPGPDPTPFGATCCSGSAPSQPMPGAEPAMASLGTAAVLPGRREPLPAALTALEDDEEYDEGGEGVQMALPFSVINSNSNVSGSMDEAVRRRRRGNRRGINGRHSVGRQSAPVLGSRSAAWS